MSFQKNSNILFNESIINLNLKEPTENALEFINKGIIIDFNEEDNFFNNLQKSNNLLKLSFSLNKLNSEDNFDNFSFSYRFAFGNINLINKFLDKFEDFYSNDKTPINLKLIQEFILNKVILLTNIYLKNSKFLNNNQIIKKINYRLSKNLIELILKLIKKHNQFFNRFKNNLLNNSSLNGTIELITNLFVSQENIIFFLENKGFYEIFNLVNNENILFEGFFEVFKNFFEKALENDDLIEITIEAEIKKFFFVEQNVNITQFVDNFKKKYSNSPIFKKIINRLCKIIKNCNNAKILVIEDAEKKIGYFLKENKEFSLIKYKLNKLQRELLFQIVESLINNVIYKI